MTCHTPSSNPDRLYHYTSVDGLRGIVENKSLWATQIQYMNDAKEYLQAVDIAQEEVAGAKQNVIGTDDEKLFEAIERQWSNLHGARTFVFSLTQEPNLLSQWRGYCPHGGVSIGFDF